MASASWEQTTPVTKFEDSPTESFVSTPGDMYPSLFATAVSPGPNADAVAMTPNSFVDDSADGLIGTPADATSSEKKAVKKRKSWGQVLPEPKTNLPPRKRAKTDDEKEQRRVERVLRNRRAAQSSRERKRLEVEALEIRNQELELALLNAQKANLMLVEELKRFRHDSGVVTRSSSPLSSMRPAPVTLSQELFSSQDANRASADGAPSTLDELLKASAPPSATVNPASLSPELAPIAETDEIDADLTAAEEPASAANTSSDLTQHPAVSSVGGSAAVLAGLAALPSASDFSLLPAAPDAAPGLLDDAFRLSTAADADRYVLESGLLSSPNSVDYDNDYLAGDSPFPVIDPFDISEFLHDDVVNGGVSADSAPVPNDAFAVEPYFGGRDLPHSETQVSSENPNLQPQSGASAYGCDDGGIAVGV